MGIVVLVLFSALVLSFVIIVQIEWKTMERRLRTYKDQIKTNAEKSESRERELRAFIEDLKSRNKELSDLYNREASTRASTEILKSSHDPRGEEDNLPSSLHKSQYEYRTNQNFAQQGNDSLKEQRRRNGEEKKKNKEQLQKEKETRRLEEQLSKAKRQAEEEAKQRASREKDLEQARHEAEQAVGKEKAEWQSKAQKLEEQLNAERIAKQNLENLNQQLEQAYANERDNFYSYRGKSGYIGILSNPKSFGDGIYRIGLAGTGMAEPPKVSGKLNFWAVPFPFYVHAMVPCEDAYEIERQLHIYFQNRRVNERDRRKKFFRASLTEIETAIRRIAQETNLINTANINFEKNIDLEANPEESGIDEYTLLLDDLEDL